MHRKLEIGTIYKVVYKDNDYSKLLTATLTDTDEHLLYFKNIKDGVVVIGKTAVISIKEAF